MSCRQRENECPVSQGACKFCCLPLPALLHLTMVSLSLRPSPRSDVPHGPAGLCAYSAATNEKKACISHEDPSPAGGEGILCQGSWLCGCWAPGHTCQPLSHWHAHLTQPSLSPIALPGSELKQGSGFSLKLGNKDKSDFYISQGIVLFRTVLKAKGNSQVLMNSRPPGPKEGRGGGGKQKVEWWGD